MDIEDAMGSNLQALVRRPSSVKIVQSATQPKILSPLVSGRFDRTVPSLAQPPVAPICVIPYDQLGIFARSYETSAPLARMPIYALAEIGVLPVPTPAPNAAAPTEPLVYYPLGLLGTNHIGYASFDLTVLRRVETIHAFQRIQQQLGQKPPSSSTPQLLGLRHLWVFPFADPLLRLDALQLGDLGPQIIALRIELDEVRLAGREMDGPMVSLQNPSILDWRLAPGSFTLSGAVLVGEDGCEAFLPANLSTQQFRFRQVARRSSIQHAASDLTHRRQLAGALQPLPTMLRAGYVLEYTTEWFSVGHSLGQLLYTLPLAPGEVVKLAIVDWSRTDTASRAEDTGFSESLTHDQLRDRTLSESVRAVLNEWQSGSSSMGGVGLAGGGGGSFGGLLGAGAGLTAAFGAAGSSTQGTRELSGQTMQHIADAFHQATTAVRELRSTVVVQSTQAEKSDLQTRVVANYNHSHALTLLYYEVLRHYRVVTRLASIRPALLVENTLDTISFDQAHLGAIISHRRILERVLLDTRLAACFDAAERYYALLNEPKPPPPPDPGITTRFVLFQLKFLTTELNSPCVVKGKLRNVENDPASDKVLLAADGKSEQLADTKRFESANFLIQGQGSPAGGPVAWRDVGFIVLHFESQGDDAGHAHTGLSAIDVSGIDEAGVEHVLGHVGGALFEGDTPEENRFLLVPASRPPAPPPPVDVKLRLSEAERTCVDRLLVHLSANSAYYNHALILNEDPNTRATRFERFALDTIPLLDLIENRALEIMGNYVAFALNPGLDPAAAGKFNDLYNLHPDDLPHVDDAFVEQLLSLPTRGVFGEAKLGSCNASEKIDDTRFWDWQKSPIPFGPPDIAGVSAASRAQAPTGLTPTPFPQSLVNIVNPGSLPDPTGLANALNVLGTPNIFRDQSGMQQLGPFLGKLADDATNLAATAMKNQAVNDLMSSIRNSSELTPAQKKDLMGQLLTGRVQQETAPKSPAVGGSSTGSGTGSSTGSGPGTATGAGTGTGTSPGTGTGTATGGGTGTGGGGTPGTTDGSGGTGGTGGTGATGGTGGGGQGGRGGTGGTGTPSKPKSTKPALPDPVPQTGLTFKISFNNVEGTTVMGTADVTIKPMSGKSETYSAKPIELGNLTLTAPTINGEGTIGIFAHYQVNSVADVLADTIGKAGTPLPTKPLVAELNGSRGYKLPTQGTVIRLTVTPKIEPKKVTASSQKAAADQVAATLTGNAEIVSVSGTFTTGTTITTGATTEWVVNVLTGGLDIQQDL
jgi:hypothetical protein